jgi:two-component system chemotaxis sensor kinase CheA
LIAAAEEALLALEKDPSDMEAIGTVFRAFHTIKGTAGFTELTLVSELGHLAESLLSRVRDGEIYYRGIYADLALHALDMIKELICSVESALGGKPLLKPEGYDGLMNLLANPDSAVEISPQVKSATSEAALQSLGEEAIEDKKPVEADSTKTSPQMGMAQPAPSHRRPVESSIRVNTQRLDRLIDMVGELVIAHSMVAQDARIVDSRQHELLKKVNQTSKIVRELQDLSMSMRMVPLKATFKKMARLVRDSARKLGKQVNFVTEGNDTEIDRNLVAVLNDPLMHMVRNAVDHGLELPEDRERAGKSAYGTIALSAYHTSGRVVVEVKDDGKGLDREKIVGKAIQQGIIKDGCQLKAHEIFNLIFEPGFSTAQAVSDISGRGVGMDVVKKNIEKLHGQIEIKSEPGSGSIFRISLPLTLAIIDGMVIRVGNETYIIPTASIISSIKPDPADISTILNQGQMLSFHGKLLPLFRLDSIFQISNAEQRLQQNLVVVVEDEAYQAGLLIDELLGRQQVVIKSLGDTMQNIPGISGGAILPDGRVGLILDVGGLMRSAHSWQGDPIDQAVINDNENQYA